MKFTRLFVAILLLCVFLPGMAQTGSKRGNGEEKIEAYYFHYTSRCATCRTVEEKAKENLELLYPALVKEGRITFQSADLNKKEGEALAKKLGVSGQTLMIQKGKKQINLTNEAFLYAVTNPDKYKAIIKEKVDALLK